VVTAVRVVLAAVVAWLLFQGGEAYILTAGILLIIAALTDWLDGFLARRLRQTSLFGSLFDMIADQLLFIPCLILAVSAGLFSRTAAFIPWSPYPYMIATLTGGITVLTGIGFYLWKRRNRAFEFPTPTGVAKVNYWFWLVPLIVAVFGVLPDVLLAVMMYLAIITTLMSFYSYLKKGSYVFTD